MNVLFITSGTKDPGTRFRAKQFFKYFEEAGIRCHHTGAYGDHYNALFQVPLVGAAYKAVARWKRATRTIAALDYDAVFLQRTAFNGSALPERLLSRINPRIIYDFDDAIFLSGSGEIDPRRRRAFDQIVGTSAHVIAGNKYLADAAAAPAKTTIIPTVIDTDHYSPVPIAPRRRIVIGWMGTAGNFSYFSTMLPALRRILAESPEAVFRIVSNGRYQELADHPQVEQVAWSDVAELEELRNFDIGIMPLVDSPWTRGKCGFKLIQYMAVGRPVIASAVGANNEILANPAMGLLVSTEVEWYGALRRLVDDSAARAAIGAAGRERVVESYSITSVIGTYIQIFERFRGRGPEHRRMER